MNIPFPSTEFDDAVAAVCHGQASDGQMRALNQLLRGDPVARDEYLLRVELHTRLASEPDLFASATGDAAETSFPSVAGKGGENILALPTSSHNWIQKVTWTAGVAACFAVLAALGFAFWPKRTDSNGTTSTAVAVLSHALKARWKTPGDGRAVGSALEPGWLRLESGLLQVTFYSGARLVIEGPAQVQLVSAGEAFCQAGRVLAEVPPQARGFRVGTPQMTVVDLGTEFGLDVKRGSAEVHVFGGEVEFQSSAAAKRSLKKSEAAVVDDAGATRLVSANPAAFASLFELQRKCLAALAARYEDWRTAGARRNQDPSLLARFDFEDIATSGWTLHNVAAGGSSVPDATIVGCQGTEGRWPGKRGLEFRNVSDRVRFSVPGEFRGLTLSAWVCVKGLDRQFNSLFMSDGFEPGTIHWLIRNDGVLGLTVFGPDSGNLQIVASPPVLPLDKLGMWLHLVAVVDGKTRQVVQYVNGTPVARQALKLGPPYRLGAAELGNWNANSGPNPGPALIRNLSGAVDEFELFSRALSDAEIRELYAKGKPDV